MVKLTQRSTLVCNGWKLAHDADDVGKKEKWFKGLPEDKAVEAYVPSYVHMILPNCFGVAWYELEFSNACTGTENDLCFIRFDMAEFRSEIYVNGKYVGFHEGCEDTFSFEISAFMKKGKNRLSVRVSKPYSITEKIDGYHFGEVPHRNEKPTILKPGCCYNSFGIHGNFHINFVPKTYIADNYLYANPKTGNVEIEYTLVNANDSECEATILSECFNKRTGDFICKDLKKITLAPGENKIIRKVKIDNFLLWDISDPNLYNVVMTLEANGAQHRTVKHCGFRTFEVGEDGFFYLNGRRVFLRCSHTGNCMPESVHHIANDKELLRRDFSMAKAAGFNMIRFISGVALQEQLDYCDEIGLMIYEEPVSGWQLYDGPHAKNILFHDTLTMVKRDRSHPCITIFGILNETPTTPPFNKVYYYARQLIKPIRQLCKGTLVLYSSGRWDSYSVSKENCDPWCGSFANPFMNKWQCVWNCDSEVPNFYEDQMKAAGTSMYKTAGDFHDYPRPPITRQRIDELRSEGVFPKRSVFVSEIGIGSLFNVLWLSKKFEQANSDVNAPDVIMVNKMAESFLNDYKRFGFDGEFAYPDDVMYESEVLHNKFRTEIFDIIRSGPHYNGISITGLLDHSICGEGLFTLMREWKPGIADTLQDGFSPLRWCMFVYGHNVYRKRPFEIEVVLANEDVLKADTDYPVSIKICSKKDGRTVYSEDLTLRYTKEELKYLSVPVLHKFITLNVPSGEYELRADIIKGAAATGGRQEFYISDADEAVCEVSEIVGVSLDSKVVAYLKKKKTKVVDIEKAKPDSKSLVVVGKIPEELREKYWAKINELMKNGSRVLALSRDSFIKGEERSYYLPVKGVKPDNMPLGDTSTDWLYHMEYVLKRDCPYAQGLPTGIMDFYYYYDVINSYHFAYTNGQKLPDKIHAAAFGTGIPNDAGVLGGVTIGTYNIGKGALTFSCYNILDKVDSNPAADKLLVNMINAENKLIKK